MIGKSIAADVRVPFVDLEPMHAAVKRSILEDVERLIDRGIFLNGPEVEAFEAEFAAYCRMTHCVGVSSGLDALRLALVASGIAPGDEVIVPAQTFVATFEAVTQAGAVPVPVDISTADYNLDVNAVEAALTARTRFLLPVHLFGQVADLKTLGRLAARHGLTLVEDACQAHGASRDGIVAGSFGHAAAFSFYPGKNLGAFGDAGAIVTSDRFCASRARALREHGQSEMYVHEEPGYTARLDCIQALVLLRKLERLDDWNEERRSAARFYLDALDGTGDVVLPQVPPGSEPVWHLFVVRSTRASELVEFLSDKGIGTGRHYPQPPHLSPAYRHLGLGPGSFRFAESLAEEGLSLPMFPGISEAQLSAVVVAVEEFFAGA